MKRKTLLLMLLMALFAPLAVNAQSTHSWGSSSTNSGTDNNANPFGRYYGYEYRVYLYPPNTMPFSGNITQLEFLPNGTLSAGGQIDVWMKTVTDVTSLSSSTTFATYKSGATLVYSNSSSPSFTSGTYVSLPLSTPVAYNYSNNEYLMILVRSVANSTSGDGGRSFYYYNPGGASNNTWYAKKDSSDPGENTVSGWGSNGTGAYLPVIRVTYSAPSTYITNIYSTSDWNEFAQNVRNGHDYSGETVHLRANINITSQSNQAGNSSNPFKGTFEGHGNTITVNMTATDAHCAPFHTVNNATINDLVITGSISSAYQSVAGLCGIATGNTTFTNCLSNVAITSTCNNSPSDANGWSTCGGFVGTSGGGDNPTFVGCAFTGSLTATRNNNGGFVGFHASRNGWGASYSGRSTYTNCIFAPSSINISNDQKAVFTGGYNGGQYVYITTTNSYYDEVGATMDIKQGTRAYTITGQSPVTVAMAGSATTTYSVSGISVYSPGITLTNNGTTTIYAASGNTVSLNLGGGNEYEADHGTLTDNGSNYTLTMTANNSVISAGSIDSYLISDEGDITTCSGTIYDSGGSNGNYNNNEDYTKTIYPGTPGMAVKLEFTAFETESVSYDYIEIYDGTSTNATLIGKFGGTSSPGIVTASNPDGALTLKWHSDNSIVKSGFAANISCVEPTPVVTISNITANSATASWTGASSSYTVRYGMGFPTEGFESGLPNGWSHIGNGSGAPESSNPHTGTYSLKFNGATSDNVVVLPQVVGSETQISFWSKAEGSNSGSFDLGYVTDVTDVSTFVTLETYTSSQHSSYTHVENYSLASVPADAHVAFRHRSGSTAWYWFIDDVVISGSESTATTSNTTYNITNLEPNCTYWVAVQGTNSEVSKPVLFQTLFAYKRFTTTGNWNVDGNWTPTGVPTATDDVVIEADATIPNNVVATANNITITTGSITIEDGGQLQHNNDDVVVTTKKEITGYGSGNAESNKGYYLISSPVDNIAVNNVTGLQTSSYDLYKFVSNNVESGELLEWVHVNGNLEAETGYIYASEGTTTLEITGTVVPSTTAIQKTLTYNEGYRFGGWNLIGNPFVCDAYVTRSGSDINFYELNHAAGYDEFQLANSTNAIAPMGGLMVQASAANQTITYSRTAPSKGAGILNIDVNRTMDRGTATLDRARVRFGEGNNLEKFQLDARHTKISIPEGSNEYSVYYADGAGTIPVNFKAQDNGRYTLAFSTEEVGFNYLHLIDNMNGNDVDLLQTPYYAFDAKSTDYASRFTLVFATGSSTGSDTFAFFNNGLWIINNPSTGSGGEATLQVVDMMGRILSSENITGSCSKAINAAPGVYMLRLINGNDVKVQKIVVRR